MFNRFIASLFLITSVPTQAGGVGHLIDNFSSRYGNDGFNIDRALLKISERENAGLPRFVTPDTRLNRVSAEPGQRIIYHFTLLKAAGTYNDSQPHQLAKVIRQEMCGDKRLAMYYKNGVTVEYHYQTGLGSEAGRVDAKPTDCGYPQK